MLKRFLERRSAVDFSVPSNSFPIINTKTLPLGISCWEGQIKNAEGGLCKIAAVARFGDARPKTVIVTVHISENGELDEVAVTTASMDASGFPCPDGKRVTVVEENFGTEEFCIFADFLIQTICSNARDIVLRF